jgi:hypothetical protein
MSDPTARQACVDAAEEAYESDLEDCGSGEFVRRRV